MSRSTSAEATAGPRDGAARPRGRRRSDLRADVRIEAEVQALVDRMASEYGRIDCAFNNAGFEAMAPLVEQTETNIDHTTCESRDR